MTGEIFNQGDTVAEVKDGQWVYTTVAKLTPTMIVLSNGNRWHRDGPHKVGEKRTGYVGAKGPAKLHTAQAALTWHAHCAVDAAASDMYHPVQAMRRTEMTPEAALDRMQALIDQARQQIAANRAEIEGTPS